MPTPPIGYWAKKAHGKPVKPIPLPRPDDPGPFWFREGTASSEGEAVAEARSAIRSVLDEWTPEQVVAPCDNAIVERTIAELESASPKRDGLITIEGSGLIRVSVQPQSVERAALILRLLVAAADQAEIGLAADKRPAVWQCEGEDVSFSLEEAADQVAHEPSGKELRAVARWEAERQATYERWGYWRDYGRPKIPKWEKHYQGRLIVRLEEVRVRSDDNPWGPIIPRSFADGKRQHLEAIIPRILATVAAIAIAKRDNRGLAERRRRAQEEARRERERLEEWNARERTRIALFEELVREHQRLLQFEACLSTLARHAPSDEAPRSGRLRAWAEAQVARVRDETFGVGLETRLARERLFGEEESNPGLRE